jgi:hypothetical protein
MKNTTKPSLERKNIENCNCQSLIDALDSRGDGLLRLRRFTPSVIANPVQDLSRRWNRKRTITNM